MPNEITTDDLKRIAEACGYDDYRCDGYGSQVLVDDEWIDFIPHLDANQAIECLDQRFGKKYRLERDQEQFCVCFRRVEEGEEDYAEGSTLPAAAMAAILASLEDDDAV